MKKAIIFIPAFNLVICFAAFAQVRKVAGLVSFNSERQSGAVIKNRSSRTQAVSNDIGEFAIMAQGGDTLTISKKDYSNDTLIVTDDPYYVIRLKKSLQMLKEVVINGTVLNPAKKLEDNKKDYREIYRIGNISNIIGPDNIDKVWSALSRGGNDARRLQRTFEVDYQNSIIDRRFTKKLVNGITGYKDKCLDYFMIKYRPTYEMASRATGYQMAQYIKEKLSEDKQHF